MRNAVSRQAASRSCGAINAAACGEAAVNPLTRDATRSCRLNDPLLIAAAAAALHDRQLAKRSADELRKFVDETIAT
jgi:hypothetical protein